MSPKPGILYVPGPHVYRAPAVERRSSSNTNKPYPYNTQRGFTSDTVNTIYLCYFHRLRHIVLLPWLFLLFSFKAKTYYNLASSCVCYSTPPRSFASPAPTFQGSSKTPRSGCQFYFFISTLLLPFLRTIELYGCSYYAQLYAVSFATLC